LTLPGSASASVGVLLGAPSPPIWTGTDYSDRMRQERRLVLQVASGRAMVSIPRRPDVVDVTKCQDCHDDGGQRPERARQQPHRHDAGGVICHNPDATDVNRRPRRRP
jgi:hypothetical protein